MYQSKQSKSKSKIVFKNLPSSQILHQGYQRKISQSQYMKSFPKIKLKLNGHSNNSNVLMHQYSQQYFCSQIQNMKGENKILEQLNQDMLAKIRKETKLNHIYQKKMENQSIQSMPLEKIIEIKLLLEVEQFEQMLKNKQLELECLVKTNKQKKQELQEQMIEPLVQLTSILMQGNLSADSCLQGKQAELLQLTLVLQQFKQKRIKMRTIHTRKLLQFDNAKVTIQKQSANSWKKQETTHQSHQNSIVSRTKNIEDIQTQIEKIQTEFRQYQIKIQQQLDKKVRQKLTLLKQIEHFEVALGKKRHVQGIMKIIEW